MKKQKTLKRDRINRTLESIFAYPLTVVEAPIGYGKTTAVTEFLANKGNSVMWITFLSPEDTVSFFWDRLSAEIGRLDRETGDRLKSLGFPADAPQTAHILSLLGKINFDDNTVLVIDDFHLAKDPKISALLIQIMKSQPDNLHIALITRDTANLDITELVAKGLCSTMPQHILRFTKDEIFQYRALMGFKTSDEELHKAYALTGGWISLVYLTLLGIEQGIPAGRGSIVDELVERVLYNAYNEFIRRFLLRLSVMDSFTAEQALFVTQEPRTNEFLKKLRRENAFVTCDEAAGVYKIHNILLDFLRTKHENANERMALLSRVGEWLLAHKEHKSAYGYFYRAGENERILALLDNVKASETFTQNSAEFDGSPEFFSSQPRELLFEYPIAYLQFISVFILSGKAQVRRDSILRLDELEEHYRQSENIPPERKNSILAEVNVIRVFAEFNDIEKMKIAIDEASRLFNGNRTCLVCQDGEFTFGSPHFLFSYYREPGKLKETADLLVTVSPAFVEIFNSCGTGGDYLALAEYALVTGDWQAAEMNALKAIYKADTKKQASIVLCANLTLIRLYIYQGKTDEAQELLRRMREDVKGLNYAVYNTTMELIEGFVYACLGRLDLIPAWLQTGDMSPGCFRFEGMSFNYIVYGKAVLLSKNYIKLEMLTEVFPQYFADFKSQYGFLHNRILTAAAKYRLYGMGAGRAEMKAAIDMAREDHIILAFAEYAPDIIEMVRLIAADTPRDEYIKKILQSCGQYIESLKRFSSSTVSLTTRETEVLTLASEGLKREEIAEKLHVSGSTVHSHLHKIYLKLEARGRLAAIKKAREMKIL